MGRAIVVAFGSLVGTALLMLWAAPAVPAATVPERATGPVAQAEQVLVWTADNSVTEYASAPTTAVAGPATIVFENSTETGNTTGMPHTLTFDTTTPGYNHDVDVDILANPYDANGGRWEVQVVLSPGTYRYFCAINGHTMSGELVVTDGGGEDDTTPPEVSASISGEQNDAGEYVGSATVTVSASDVGSGVASVEYELDGGGFQSYSGPVEVTERGAHTVRYRATDSAGNTSEPGTVGFTVVDPPQGDTTPPEVSASISGEQNDAGEYVGSATVTVSAQDAESGVASVEYSLNGAPHAAYEGPVEVNQPGMHMFSYRATDNAGNTSESGMVHFTIVEQAPEDTTPPEVSASVAGEQNDAGEYAGSATVTVAAEDAESGVASVEYSLDGAPYGVYEGPVEVNQPGAHTVSYRAADNAGNTSEPGSVTFTVVEPDGGGDACPESDTRDTVIIDGRNTGVPNVDTGDGCTISDLIAADPAYRNHGAFVHHVAVVTDELAADGVISGQDKGRIMRAAARSDIGKH